MLLGWIAALVYPIKDILVRRNVLGKRNVLVKRMALTIPC